jgi:hypothetical protein
MEKYLRIARSRYKQLAISIETLLDVSTLSVEDITGRLMASEDDPEPPPFVLAGGKLTSLRSSDLSATSRRRARVRAIPVAPGIVGDVVVDGGGLAAVEI